jgi:site-specific DNA recombinase
MHGIMASFAEYYSNNLSAEVRKGMDQKAKVGGTPTRAPLGYLNVPEVVGTRVIHSVAIDNERAPLIREAFELYATGEYSIVDVCEALNTKGLRSRAGKIVISKPVAWGTLAKLLSKPYYTGDIMYKGVRYEGRHTPLISKELFERVQQVMKSRVNGERQRVHLHYLKSSLSCMRCGSPLCITAAKSEYLYYYCAARAKRHLCDLPYVETGRLEQCIIDFYRSVKLSDQEAEDVRGKMTAHIEKSQVMAKADSKRQQARLDALKDERTKLMQAFYAHAIPMDVLTTEQTRIAREVNDAETIIAQGSTRFDEIKGRFEQVLWLLQHCAEAYAQAPNKLRRMMNQALFAEILVDQDPDTGKPNLPGVTISRPFEAVLELSGRHLQSLQRLTHFQSQKQDLAVLF